MRLLKISDVSDMLGLSAYTVRQMIREGRLRVVRPTGRRVVRVREDDVAALMQPAAMPSAEVTRHGPAPSGAAAGSPSAHPA